MEELIINDHRFRPVNQVARQPKCSDCKMECVIVPDEQVHPRDLAAYARPLSMPEFKNHVFAFCPSCKHLLLFAVGVNPSLN